MNQEQKIEYIAIEETDSFEYPSMETMFRPGIRYPEYPFGNELSEKTNQVYDMVRNCFVRLGYDKQNIGTRNWNPLGHLIKPGQNVFIKPNLVYDKNLSGKGIACVNTNPSVLAPVIDYVILALGSTVREGHIIVGDAPMQECDFDKMVAENGLRSLIDYYNKKHVPVKLVDCRCMTAKIHEGAWTFIEQNAPYHIVSLGEDSEFEKLNDKQLARLRKGANDTRDLFSHHHRGIHEYAVSDYLLNCDVLINMPKPKLHKKAGVTISLKNLVGISAKKEYLPHHMEGDAETGRGDAYFEKNIFKSLVADTRDKVYTASWNNRKFAAFFWRTVRSFFMKLEHLVGFDGIYDGMWIGNETIPKMVLDLNKIELYADKEGRMCNEPQRKQLIVADMIVAGQGNGPLSPTPKNAGLIAVAENCPINFDECIATLMGADVHKIPTLRAAREITGKYNFVQNEGASALMLSSRREWNMKGYRDISKSDTLGFVPIDSWKEAFNI